jgi:DNA-binding transcriptional ArsR family regulator
MRSRVLHDLKLSQGARLAYMLLDDLGWKGGGEVSAPQAELADRLGVPKRSVERYLRELRVAGYLTVQQQGPVPAAMVLAWKRVATSGGPRQARSATREGVGSTPVADQGADGLCHAHKGNTIDKQDVQDDRSTWPTMCPCGNYHSADARCACGAVHRQAEHQRLNPVTLTRGLLVAYVRQVGLPWQEPDDAICARVLAAAGGDMGILSETLRWLLLDRRLAPFKSYAWFATVVAGSVRQRA